VKPEPASQALDSINCTANLIEFSLDDAASEQQVTQIVV
jgi:hypothetical protein